MSTTRRAAEGVVERGGHVPKPVVVDPRTLRVPKGPAPGARRTNGHDGAR